MIKRKKLWTSMKVAALAGIVTLEGCSTEDTELGEGAAGETLPGIEASAGAEGEGEAATIGSEGEGEGEGEGNTSGEGEGEGEGSGADLASDDLAYLTQISLMRGHLLVGNALFQEGHVDHAQTHMKHPESELYAAIAPAFEARGNAGFADELQALASSVENQESKESVATNYEQLMTAMSNAESVAGSDMASTKQRLKLIVELLRVAAQEYAIAVVDGKMQNAHEYQDAFGFTTVAKTLADNTSTTTESEVAALASAKKLLSDLDKLWPSLMPPETLDTEAAEIYGAASRVELLALGL